MALRFADATTDKANFGSAASIDNIDSGTIAICFKPANISNALRQLVIKSTGVGDLGWTIFRPGVSGATLNLQVSKSVVAQTVSTGAVITANEWQTVAFTWSMTSGGPKAYRGTLTSTLIDISTTPDDGTGTKVDDSSGDFRVGSRDGASAALPCDVAWVGLWTRVLSLGELQAQQTRPHPTAGCVLFSVLGYNGTGTQPDWSGNGNVGTVTGATLADHAPIPFRRVGQLYAPYAVAAPGGGIVGDVFRSGVFRSRAVRAA
jgi:hypothetical protein